MSRLQGAFGRVKLAILRQISPEALSSLLHVFLLFVLITIVRPLFSASISAQHYEDPSILISALLSDLSMFHRAATRNAAAIPEVAFLFIPTLYFMFAKRKLRWTDWSHGTTFRALVMAILAVAVWSGTTFEYNNYLHRGHAFDRILLLSLYGLSWRFPLAVPFAVRVSIIMMREAYVPINLDDFEFRTVTELLTIFSIFIWASAKRSFQPWHVVIVGVGSWASYYYIAGVAKWTFGPKYSWLLENHLTNLAFSTNMRGWFVWISPETFIKIVEWIRPYDVALTFYTLLVEFGSLGAFLFCRRSARLWFALCFLLHFGIFTFSGVFFWKWMLVNAAFIWWFGVRGRPILDKFYEYKLPLALTCLAVFFSANRIWYYPQTHVVWYDTQMLDQYDIVVVGKSGEKYVVDPNYFAPQDLHFAQGAFCYATDNERTVTHIYGTTGSYDVMKQLNTFTDPKQALQLHNRGPVCSNPNQRTVFDNYMKRFFGNINRYGRPWDWLVQFGSPHHLWIDVREGKEFRAQEKVTRLELWRTTMYAHGGKYHNLEKKLTHQIQLPNAD